MVIYPYRMLKLEQKVQFCIWVVESHVKINSYLVV